MKGKLTATGIVLFFMVLMVLGFSVFAQADDIVETGIDLFEYATNEELSSIYSIECDGGTSLAAVSDAVSPYQGDYCAKLSYSLGELWSSVKLVRYFPDHQNWSGDKNISLWVKGYSGCTENLLVYVIENDCDEWAYQSSAALINEAWTKIVIPLSDLWDNPWDSNFGDGIKTLTNVIGYKIIIQDIVDDGISPAGKSIYLDEFMKDDGSLSTPHLIPDINNYTCYYGAGRAKDLSKFDFIIIESRNYSAAEIAQMKANGAKAIGYVSLGEDVRSLHAGDGIGPISSGVLTYSGYSSYYLDDNPKDNYPDQNQSWGGYYVNAGNIQWQNYIINTLINEVVNIKGCDGVFMDTIGIVDDTYYSWTTSGMISLIAAIRKAYPDKYLVANRGFSIFDKYEEYVNALMFESFTSTYDFTVIEGVYKKWDNGSLEYTANLANQINSIRGYPENPTINVFSLDYCERDNAVLYTEDCTRAESFGFIPGISDIYLSKIYMVNPANNLNAVVVKVGSKRKVNLSWDAPAEYVADSNVLNFVIKRSATGPIVTDADWNNAYIVSSSISASARSFTDINPPKGQVYYAIGAVKNGGMNLIGHPAASCFVK